MPNKYNIAFDLPFLCQYGIPIGYAIWFPINYGLLIKNRSKYYADRAIKETELAEKSIEKKEK